MMGRRRFLLILLGAVGAPLAAAGQQAGKIARIGYLLLPPLAEKPSAERQAFLQGLRELGYDEGRNFVIEYRSAAWNLDLLPELAAQLIELKVDVLLTAGPQPTLAAREATRTIPIVMVAGIDPWPAGSLPASPGQAPTSPDSRQKCRG
jgi:putative tryptophan/tyrosine transport system substrate-binding protein